MARRDYYFETKTEQDSVRNRVVRGFELAVDQRKQMKMDALLAVLEDRDKRFYRAMLIYKVGAYGYHMVLKGSMQHFREQFTLMMQVKELWDVYLDSVRKGVIREHLLEQFPKIRGLELMVENWIWWAEYTMELRAKGEEHRWSIDTLELASKVIDTGCLKVEGGSVRMIKTPPITGWEAAFKP